MEVAILGPNRKLINASLRRTAYKYVKNIFNDYNHFKEYLKLRNVNGNYVAVNNKGKLVGFVLMNMPKNNSIEILVIGTKSHLGVGSQLINAVVKNARNRGLKKIVLEHVNQAKNFYIKKGFVNNGSNRMRLNLNLKPSRGASRS